MNLLQAYRAILTLEVPIFQTSDIRARLRITNIHASKILSRLGSEGFVVHLARGLWALAEMKDPFLVPEYLTRPRPSYISVHSALYHHGMIDQIPNVIYAVSLARTRRYETPLGVFSIHQVNPGFFFGYEPYGKHSIKMAWPEKALLDFFYLSQGKSGWFRKLPELELPQSFSKKRCQEILQHIDDPIRRQAVAKHLHAL